MGNIYTNPPQSRNEAILRATIDGTEYTDPPQSRIEDLLIELKEAIDEGGGSVESYEQLTNKPQINGTTLSGDKSTEDLIPIDKGLEFDSDGKLAVSLGNGLAFNSDGEIDNLTEANPSDSATGELSKLKVGSDIYSVVTKAVNDLANYYTKSDVYTKAEVNNIAQARFAVVAQLPTEDIQTNVIYLVPKSTAQTNNDYDEYIYALKSTNPDTYGWEKIGDTEIDLSDYVTTQALNTALANYTTTTDLTTLLAGKQNTLTYDAQPTENSTNDVKSGGIYSFVTAQGAKTASGNPITLTDAEAMNADHVVATITPTQTGSGTPSPSNVRPFVGFSSVDIARCGKNLFNKNSQQIISGKRLSTSTGGTYSDGNFSVSHYIKVNPSEFYTLSTVYTSYFCVYDENLVFKQGGSWHDGQSIQMPSNVKYIRFDFPTADIDVVQFEKGQQATTYEPYQGQTYTVQLGDTYYQAEIDLTDGVLRCRQKFAEFNGSEQWAIENGYRATHIVSDIKSNTSNSTVPNILSSQFEATTPNTTWWGGTGVSVSLTNVLLVAYGDYTKSADAWKTYLEENPLQVVYELATPIEIQLTPTQIALLENNNTITTNVSSLDITYQTNTAIGDTASALDKRVTSLEIKVPQPPTTDGTYNLTVTVASGEPTYSWESAT